MAAAIATTITNLNAVSHNARKTIDFSFIMAVTTNTTSNNISYLCQSLHISLSIYLFIYLSTSLSIYLISRFPRHISLFTPPLTTLLCPHQYTISLFPHLPLLVHYDLLTTTHFPPHPQTLFLFLILLTLFLLTPVLPFFLIIIESLFFSLHFITSLSPPQLIISLFLVAARCQSFFFSPVSLFVPLNRRSLFLFLIPLPRFVPISRQSLSLLLIPLARFAPLSTDNLYFSLLSRYLVLPP
ncbi:unnamed protein product [Acanthosepion pharaonis]|uniref:Uncharacterized protein n=1 Tax=Acanthosepion pharaonis TaxID=158019 RepID=A0A812EZZ5_ACAPH|nr:unnamed protein product [Sepia pharaonis]